MEIRILYSICKEGKVLPPTWSLLLLASARHSWTIPYRFPTSAANTWERISPPSAPPRLGGAHPSYLTAEARPFRAFIGASGKWGGDRRENSVSDWTVEISLSPPGPGLAADLGSQGTQLQRVSAVPGTKTCCYWVKDPSLEGN